jgi:hypothetical protein
LSAEQPPASNAAAKIKSRPVIVVLQVMLVNHHGIASGDQHLSLM